jgi:FdhD protein
LSFYAPEGAELIEVMKVRGDERARRMDLVVHEAIYAIKLNGTRVASLACTPSDLESLAVGYLQSERIIVSSADVRSLLVKRGERSIEVVVRDGPDPSTVERLGTIVSGCGSGRSSVERPLELLRAWRISSRLTVPASTVVALMRSFQGASALFRSTGGIHSAAICEPSGLIIFKEDIGRHNAVDKVLGECLLKGVSTKDKILLTTGRVSSDVLIKAALREIPIVASRSAPTHLAIKAAGATGLTLVGFVRGEGMNIYANEWRIS